MLVFNYGEIEYNADALYRGVAEEGKQPSASQLAELFGCW